MIKALLLLLFVSSAFATELRLLTYNVYMIPKPVRFSKQNIRTAAFIDVLSKSRSDVILLQEAFCGTFRKKISKALMTTHPYSYHLPMKFDFTHWMNSGVMVFSKYPFTVLDSAYYKDCAGADCLASKGVVLLDLTVDGKHLHVATTHMQASGTYGTVRQKQLMDIKNVFDKHATPGVPQILAGDLNVDAMNGLEFITVLKLTGLTAEGSDLTQSSKAQKTSCFGKKDTPARTRKDHVLHRGPVTVKTQVEYVKWTDDRVECDLSDHHPVSAIVNF